MYHQSFMVRNGEFSQIILNHQGDNLRIIQTLLYTAMYKVTTVFRTYGHVKLRMYRVQLQQFPKYSNTCTMYRYGNAMYCT